MLTEIELEGLAPNDHECECEARICEHTKLEAECKHEAFYAVRICGIRTYLCPYCLRRHLRMREERNA